MKHLGCYDHRFPGINAFVDDHFLNAGDLLIGYFYAKVTAGYHYTVNMLKDLVNILYAFLIFYFCYDLNP